MQHGDSKKLASASVAFRLYTAQALKHPILLLLIFVGSFVLQGANIVAPLYLRQFFNLLAASAPSPGVVYNLLAILGIVVFMWFLEWVGRRIQDISNVHMQSRVMADLFGETFNYLLKHSYNFFISHFSGTLTHRVTKFVRAFETLTDSILIQFFPTFIFIVGAVAVLSLRNLWLGMALGAWTIAFVGFQILADRIQGQAVHLRIYSCLSWNSLIHD